MRRWCLPLLSWACLLSPQVHAESGPPATLASLFRTTVDGLGPVVRFCAEVEPGLKGPLEAAHADFSARFDVAFRAFSEERGLQSVLAQPLGPDVAPRAAEVGDRLVREMGTLDRERQRSICRAFLAQWDGVTVTAIRASLERAFDEYTAGSRERAPPRE